MRRRITDNDDDDSDEMITSLQAKNHVSTVIIRIILPYPPFGKHGGDMKHGWIENKGVAGGAAVPAFANKIIMIRTAFPTATMVMAWFVR